MTQTDNFFLENKPLFSGKIREIYNFSDDTLLIKTSDKISAFDFVFDDEIFNKGTLLTNITKFWFNKTKNIIKNHYLDDDSIKKILPMTHKSCMLVKKCKPIRIEAIVRGYISGSAFDQYNSEGKVSDIIIREGLKLNDKFDKPIFTPSTKADVGNKDENITFSDMCNLLGTEVSNYIKEKSIELYSFAHEFAESKGLWLLDTKFEFGYDKENNIILIDEIFTPDCSRYCMANNSNNVSADFFDKQFFRNYLIETNWNQSQIIIPEEIKDTIIKKYQKVYDMITNV
tara:strand:+ start:2429 stop:3286 length:858 start_codon:yes stop_codon:yes gene_type:complete